MHFFFSRIISGGIKLLPREWCSYSLKQQGLTDKANYLNLHFLFLRTECLMHIFLWELWFSSVGSTVTSQQGLFGVPAEPVEFACSPHVCVAFPHNPKIFGIGDLDTINCPYSRCEWVHACVCVSVCEPCCLGSLPPGCVPKHWDSFQTPCDPVAYKAVWKMDGNSDSR